MTIVGKPQSYYDKFLFRVEIDGITYAGFSKCSELKKSVAEIQHFEGGSLIPDKSPGRVTVADVTLERGASNDLELYGWFENVVKVAAGQGGQGQVDGSYKRNFDIVQLDRDGTVLQRWECVGAWPKDFVAGDWDNDSDEKQITSVVLAIDDFEPTIRR